MLQRRGAYVILIGVVLLVWQFYVAQQSQRVENIKIDFKSFSNKVPKHFNSIGNEEKHENYTKVTMPNPLVLKTTLEPYRVMENYEQERPPEVDTPFKRILFWNDVIEYLNIA